MTREFAWVDSAEEQLAYLIARFGPQASWEIRDQRIATLEGGAAVERTRLRTSLGEVEVEFRDASPRPISFTEAVEERSRTGTLDAIMERAATFAAENPPHHPGSLPRFPVPVEHYGNAVGVPLPILAVDDLGRRGLFAPPRLAVVDWTTHEPVGVREFPGFDPESWPPRRLGDWPAPGAARLVPEQLEATIHRFSACWSRVIEAWLANRDKRGDALRADAGEALRLRRVLDPEAMEPVYRRINPSFAGWVDALTDQP
jgi:hypothetical protein